jgi:MoaA/NifB/PqqE/SkfB family radical SAM enzyme
MEGFMPQASSTLATAPTLRLRHEHFGALAWRTDPRRIWRLDPTATAVTLLYQQPRPANHTQTPSGVPAIFGLEPDVWGRTVADLVEHGVLTASDLPARRFTTADARAVAARVAAQTPTVAVLKPLWVHLQPFTRCNQHCLHCYCSGGPKADPFLLDVDTWRRIVAALDDYGILDVYVTGGESLLLDGFFDVAEDILGRGMGFGVSTNATVISDRVLARLRDLRIGAVQVSLDGATAGRHELIRGAPGSFTRTLTGIDRIATFTDVVINTVVNRLNAGELEQIVRLGIEHGCTRFKFFPQKPVGRSTHALTLNDAEIMDGLVPECVRLAATHQVEIETIDPGKPCGSGSVGFAVDQRADIYPCIFGVENIAQRCGNLLYDDLDAVWFHSPVLAAFRGKVTTPCRRCEP